MRIYKIISYLNGHLSDESKKTALPNSGEREASAANGKILEFSYIPIKKSYIQGKNSPADWNKYFHRRSKT
jgi:hypothetical protein